MRVADDTCCHADYNSISKFLNRLLGIEVTLQNAFFRYFMNTLSAIILQAKRNGRWDMGILGNHFFNEAITARVLLTSADA